MEEKQAAKARRHYQGDLLIAPGAFLRSLPANLDSRLIFLIAGIVNAGDAIAVSWQALSSSTAEARRNERTIIQKARMFNSAWSIVNNLHTARLALIQIRAMLGITSPEFEHYIEVANVARGLRNGIEHFVGSAGNHAKKTGPRFPLFGVLVYVYRSTDEPDRPFTVFEFAGPHTGGTTKADFIAPSASVTDAPATSQFHLSGFDKTLDFTDAIQSFEAMAVSLNHGMEVNYRAAMERKTELSAEQKFKLLHALPPDFAPTIFIREE